LEGLFTLDMGQTLDVLFAVVECVLVHLLHVLLLMVLGLIRSVTYCGDSFAVAISVFRYVSAVTGDVRQDTSVVVGRLQVVGRRPSEV